MDISNIMKQREETKHGERENCFPPYLHKRASRIIRVGGVLSWGSCIITLENGRNRNVSAEVVVCVKRRVDRERECELNACCCTKQGINVNGSRNRLR